MPALLALSLLAALVAEPSAAAEAHAPDATERAEALRTIVVRATPVSFAALRAELAPRWPESELLEVGPAAFERVEGKSFAYLEVIGEPVGGAPVEITLILSDGRAYVRRAAVPGSDRARALAIAIANLLGAVADEDIPPDRVGVDVPESVDSDPDPNPTPNPSPSPSPNPSPSPSPIPIPIPEPWRVAIGGSGGVLVGIAPAERRTRPAFGGGLRLVFRAPRGLAIGTSVRVAGQARSDHRLTRIRVGLDVGFVGRKGALEWAVGLGPTAEPWVVTAAGERRALGRSTGAGDTVLWGGAAFASLGYHHAFARARRRGPTSLRIGGTVELATSTLGSGAAARVLLPRDDGDPRVLFSLGGVELWIGLDATLWFDLPRPVRARSSTATRTRSPTRPRREI